jgi:CRP/FNR family transcriptional regulator
MVQPSKLQRSPINVIADSGRGLCAACDSRHVGVCDALNDDDLQFLAGVAKRFTIAKGQGFVTEGDPARHFFNINQGTAKLYKDLPDGRRQITGFAGLGDFIGLAAASHYAFSAEAIDPVQLCRFDRVELRTVFAKFPAIERRLLAVASHELIIAQEQMLLLGRKTAIERVASCLEIWHQRGTACHNPPNAATPKPGASPAIDLPMSRLDLADYLGMTVETVSRALAALRKRGVVSIAADHRISILNAPQLAGIAQAAA